MRTRTEPRSSPRRPAPTRASTCSRSCTASRNQRRSGRRRLPRHPPRSARKLTANTGEGKRGGRPYPPRSSRVPCLPASTDRSFQLAWVSPMVAVLDLDRASISGACVAGRSPCHLQLVLRLAQRRPHGQGVPAFAAVRGGTSASEGPGLEGDFHPSAVSRDRKSTRLNSSHVRISYAVFCLKKKKKKQNRCTPTKRKQRNTKKS